MTINCELVVQEAICFALLDFGSTGTLISEGNNFGFVNMLFGIKEAHCADFDGYFSPRLIQVFDGFNIGGFVREDTEHRVGIRDGEVYGFFAVFIDGHGRDNQVSFTRLQGGDKAFPSCILNNDFSAEIFA